MRRRRRWRRLRRICLFLVAAGLLTLAGGWLGLRHIPVWYHPAPVADDQLQRVRDSLTDAFREISDRMVRAKTFEFALTDQRVSEWITARGQIWPDADEWLPDWLKDPVLAFTPGRVVLGVLLDRDGWQTIVGVHFSIQILGHDVVLRLEKVTAGALPVPLAALAGPLEKLIYSDRLDPEAMPDELARAIEKLRDGPALSFLSQDQRIHGPFIWKNGDRPYNLTNIQIGKGWVKAKIQPL